MKDAISGHVSHAVETFNAAGTGPALILCEHASCRIPRRFQGLGLSPAQRRSHVAWDPGARAVAVRLAQALDAPLVASRVSRLVYDCNRPPRSPDAMPERSETVDVPGNHGLTAAQRQARIDAVYRPFCNAVTAVLAQRAAPGCATVLITVHSFTPVYFGRSRSVELGILHDADARMADAMLSHAGLLSHRRIERNAPYGPADGVMHSLRLHGIGNRLPNVMIEIRNDLLADEHGQRTVTDELLQLIRPALASLAGADAAAARRLGA